MARTYVWQDDYWLLLMQLYLRKPVGVKPLYSRGMVDLSLELHIPPQALQARMQQIARLQTRRIERIWNTYSKNPQRLRRAVALYRNMSGFGAANDFYEGVEVQETFEKEFRPVVQPSSPSHTGKLQCSEKLRVGALAGMASPTTPLEERVTPVMLILILNLYFQLTPGTMVSGTPEVQQLAKTIKLTPAEVVQVMDIFQTCDPYLKRDELILSPLLLPCQQIWQRFGNHEPTEIAAFADQLKEYFLS